MTTATVIVSPRCAGCRKKIAEQVSNGTVIKCRYCKTMNRW